MLQTPLSVFTGGAERAVTVLNGLRALAGMARADDLVAVHDAARPCVRHTDLLRVIAAATANNDGALLARPVAETVKRSDGGNRVDATADRRGLWLAQTPQVFRFAVLRAALERALAAAVSITDEASAIEYQGGHPELVMGSADNIKITLAEDLRLAALYLADRAEEAGNICA